MIWGTLIHGISFLNIMKYNKTEQKACLIEKWSLHVFPAFPAQAPVIYLPLSPIENVLPHPISWICQNPG